MRAIKIYAILCLIAFLGGVLQPVIVPGAIVEYFTPKPEIFTELYFEDHLNLPVRISAYTEYSFRFTIRNRTNKRMEYTYDVWTDLDGERLNMDKHSVVIEKDQNKTIMERFVTTDYLPRTGKVIVELPDNKQRIAFYMKGIQ